MYFHFKKFTVVFRDLSREKKQDQARLLAIFQRLGGIVSSYISLQLNFNTLRVGKDGTLMCPLITYYFFTSWQKLTTGIVFLNVHPTLPTSHLMYKVWQAALLGITGYSMYTPHWSMIRWLNFLSWKVFDLGEGRGHSSFLALLWWNPKIHPITVFRVQFGTKLVLSIFTFASALHTQGLTPSNPLFDTLYGAECTKGFIPMVYTQFLAKCLLKFPLPCKRRWKEGLGSLSEELWDEVLQSN